MRSSLLVLLVLALAAAAVPLGQAGAQTLLTNTAEQPPFAMGFGPGVLSPISLGVPIYTGGDQVWLMADSQNQFAATLKSPAGAELGSVQVSSTGPTLLTTFSPLDPAGNWSISVVDESQPSLSLAPITIPLVQDDLSPPQLASYHLSTSGQLKMSFDLSASIQYDIAACAVGSAVPDIVSIPLPATVGTGEVLIGLNGTQASISAQGLLVYPFNFWMELHQNYSYYLGTPSTVVSRDVDVATSQAVSITPQASSVNAPFTPSAQVRTGVFTLRAYFDTPSGLSVSQTQILMPDRGGSWVWLPGCSATADATSSPFTLSSSLGANSSTWPTALFTTYESEGVGLVAETPLYLMPAVVSVVATPWSTPVTDSLLQFTAGPSVVQSAAGDGSLYLVASQYPVQVGVSLARGQTQEVVIQRPFSTVRVSVNSSKLAIETFLNGVPAPGGSISILSGNQTFASAVTGSTSSIFYLPQGNYTIVAALGNGTQTRSFFSDAGRSYVVSIDFVSPPTPGSIDALWAAAAVGAVASVLAWVKVYRDRR